jgi:branched-chain amino acid transport system ATP-binding protein
MLTLKGVTKRFGGHSALSDVTLDVPDGGFVSLIGPNGSGKSTLFNVVSGIYKPTAGRVLLAGQDVTGWPPHRIANEGIARTFQMTRVFSSISVLDNVLAAQHTRVRSRFWQLALSLPAVHAEELVLRERARRALDFVGLDAFREHRAGSLSVGQRRLLQLAMALVCERRMLMLDEPAAGLSPPNVEKLVDLLKRIRGEWPVSVLLVEHVMSLVMAVSDSVAVLNFGRLIAVGVPAVVKADPAVVEAYLGYREH